MGNAGVNGEGPVVGDKHKAPAVEVFCFRSGGGHTMHVSSLSLRWVSFKCLTRSLRAGFRLAAGPDTMTFITITNQKWGTRIPPAAPCPTSHPKNVIPGETDIQRDGTQDPGGAGSDSGDPPNYAAGLFRRTDLSEPIFPNSRACVRVRIFTETNQTPPRTLTP